MAKLIELDNIQVRKVSKAYYFFKRTADLLISMIGLLLIGWFLLIMSLIIVCTSKGHAIYFDKRIGYKGKKINVLKFRSMYSDANTNLEKYLTPEQIKQFEIERKVDNDPRITPVGRFIRKTSIDELPQLLNIFIGNMSLVGPRPITEEELNQHFTDKQKEILLSAKPGLTGNWQVSGRNNLEFDDGERQKVELNYFTFRSLGQDIKILFKTVPAVLKHKGAK